ncbi:MAG: hypothetical protein K6G23_08415 [Lachnospiraceae bacterium]|nr:hypothetical protein [Lachnospiraceae bacterium]
MVFVLLNWLVILITTFGIGYAGWKGAQRFLGAEERVQSVLSVLFAGLALACAYAQYVSIVHRVSILAFSIFAGAALLSIVRWHKEMRDLLQTSFHRLGRPAIVAVIALTLLVCFFTSRGSFIHDTNLYHAQSVRWIEEYGVVKGLGNIQSRASYNSGFFCLTALYAMKYAFGQSMHTVQGLMALLLAIACLPLGELFHREHRSLRIADFARLGAVYYLSLTYREIMSPSSDFAVMIMLFYIVIRFLDLAESGVKEASPYALLCVLGAFVCTLKLTVGLILLIVILPVIYLLRDRKGRYIWRYLLTGTLLVVPYLIRNVIISGWLLYPSTALDLFDVDWKVPKLLADADAYQIRIWGKGIHIYGPEEAKIWTWMPNWFQTVLTSTEKLLVIAAMLAVIVVIVRLVRYALMDKEARSAQSQTGAVLLLETALMASFLFWLFSAPLTRYGYAYILLFPMVTFGELLVRHAGEKKATYLLALSGCLVIFGWKGAVLAQGVASSYLLPYYIVQTDYDNNEAETRSYEINGITFYEGVSGYHKLPGGGICFTMRGDRIEDGFIFEEKNETNIEWNE